MELTPRTSMWAQRLGLSLWALTCCMGPHKALAKQGPVVFEPWVARANTLVVQNTTGNAYALQVGYSPQMHLTQVPVGLTLLLEYSALRDTLHRIFSAPSAQLLVQWGATQRLQLALGAGAQFWIAPTGKTVRPVVTAEAHYLPFHRPFRWLRSGFVAASMGASSGAGLQVRAGVSVDLHPEQHRPQSAPQPPIQPVQETGVCPPCPVAAPVPVLPIVKAAEADSPLAHKLLFAFNHAELNAEAQAYLAQLAAALLQEPEGYSQVAIVGHASAKGTEAHNLTVSMHRAHNVAQALVALGVPENRVTVHAVGESQPLADVDPESTEQRRVSLHLVGIARHGPLYNLTLLPAPTAEEQP